MESSRNQALKLKHAMPRMQDNQTAWTLSYNLTSVFAVIRQIQILKVSYYICIKTYDTLFMKSNVARYTTNTWIDVFQIFTTSELSSCISLTSASQTKDFGKSE